MSSVRLFANVGQVPPPEQHVVVLGSWTESVDDNRYNAWEAVQLAARRDLTTHLARFHRERDRQWNDLIRLFTPLVRNIAEAACNETMLAHSLKRSPLATVSWDCVHTCMEYEYADLKPPGFFHRPGQLYLLGRFPCGWRGEFPEGVLEIY